MDEKLWLFFNDVDWARRLQALGREIWYVDEARVVHHLGASTSRYKDFAAEWHRNRIAYYSKHHGVVGSLLTRGVAVFAAFRQCVRIKRSLPFGKEYWRSVKVVLSSLGRVLRS